jgi:hypothetical protein
MSMCGTVRLGPTVLRFVRSDNPERLFSGSSVAVTAVTVLRSS